MKTSARSDESRSLDPLRKRPCVIDVCNYQVYTSAARLINVT